MHVLVQGHQIKLSFFIKIFRKYGKTVLLRPCRNFKKQIFQFGHLGILKIHLVYQLANIASNLPKDLLKKLSYYKSFNIHMKMNYSIGKVIILKTCKSIIPILNK